MFILIVSALVFLLLYEGYLPGYIGSSSSNNNNVF